MASFLIAHRNREICKNAEWFTYAGNLSNTGSLTTRKVSPRKREVASNQDNIPAQKSKWFSGIDSIRFVLAFIVVLSHCPNPIQAALHSSGTKVLRYLGSFIGLSYVGIVAVIAFFVISGFVIHYPNQNGIKNLQNFYAKRFIRILLPLVIVSVAGIPFGNPEQNIVWSLYCELIYYAIYPLLAAIKTSWRNKLIGAFALSALITVTLGRHELISMFTQADRNYKAEFWQFGIGLTWLMGLPCWLLGVVLAEKIDSLHQVVTTKKIMLLRASMFFLAVTVCVLRFHYFISYIITLTLLSVPIAKWIEMEIFYYRSKKPIALLERFGKFSYSLYLCHPIIIAFLLRTVPLNNYSYFGYLLICIAGAYLFYIALEKPIHLLAEKLSVSPVRR